MKYLNRLKNLKFYSISGYKIKAIDENIKDQKKNQLIIYKGFKENSFIEFLNSGILYYQNFKNIYTPRIYRTSNRKSRLITNISDYQQEIKSKSIKSYRVERNEKLFKGRNYIVDSSKFINLENKSLMTKNFKTVLDSIKNTYNNLNNPEEYENLLYVINVDGYNKSSQEAIRPNTKDFMSSLFMMIKNQEELPHKENQNVVALFVSIENGIMFKFDFKDYNKLNNRLRQRLRRAIDLNTQQMDTDEISNVEDDDNTEAIDSTIKKKSFNNVKDIDPIELQDNNKDEINQNIEDSKMEKISKKIDDTLRYIKSNDNIDMDINDEYNIAMIIEKELNDNNDLIDIDEDTLYNDVLDKNDSFKSIKRDIKNKSYIGDTALKNSKKILSLSKNQDEYLEKLEDFSFSEDSVIDREINENVNSINDEAINNVSSNDFDLSYMKKTFNKDFVNIMKSFNDKEEIPVFISKMNVEDNSDSQSLKNTVKVQFKSPDGINHNVKFDVPKIIDGKYLKLNGGKKVLTKQLMMYPIVKYRPDTVWITTNYNKFIIEKFGSKENSETEWLKKVIEDKQVLEYIKDKNDISIQKGNSSLINKEYLTSVLYNNLSKNILRFSKDDLIIDFNQRNLKKVISESKTLSEIDYDKDKYYPIGYNSNKSKLILSNTTESIIFKATKSNIESMNINITDYIIEQLEDNIDFSLIDKKFSKNIQASKTMAFSRVKITNKLIPTIVLLGFYKGLTSILDLYEVDYKFVKENERITIKDKKNKIKFQDGYLIYSTDKLRYDLLLSGLNTIPTSQYDFEEFNSETPYLEYFNDKFYSRNVGKGIKNALDLAMDPITEDVLRDLKLPETMVELLLLANTMLEDVTAREHNDMGIYRVRGPEQVNALIYKMIANAYKEYSDSYNNKNPKNISVKQDQLIKTIMEQPTVDEVSDLNPSLEIDKMTSVTFKGPAGRNNEQSYEPDIRSYSESMQGVLGISSPDSNKIGVVRQLSYNSLIKSTRGYTDGGKKDANDTSLYTPLELLNPYSSRHADDQTWIVGLKTI
ncbi:viral RNA polymerase beta subunit [Staphylococcus phage vB_StaM_PB50]|nr:viral RNA polymerase beta subunit [Staphylococcus phage vB_StaM_PB50]